MTINPEDIIEWKDLNGELHRDIEVSRFREELEDYIRWIWRDMGEPTREAYEDYIRERFKVVLEGKE